MYFPEIQSATVWIFQQTVTGNNIRTENKTMTQINLPYAAPACAIDGATTDHFFSEQQFQKDVDYYRAQTIVKAMLDAGLISLSQYNKLTELNRKSFSPFLAEILPKTVENTSVQR